MKFDKKTLLIIISFTVGTTVLWYGINYYRYLNSSEYQADQLWERLLEEERTDPYGGDTPEETMRLFIEAIEIKNTELAVKYFALEEQEEWSQILGNLSDERLEATALFLGRAKLASADPNKAFFTVVDSNNIVAEQIILVRKSNNKWKIQEL